MNEGFYPASEWFIYPQVYHCANALNKNKEEPHTWVPSFAEGDQDAPDFICGGYPKRIIDIEEARDKR